MIDLTPTGLPRSDSQLASELLHEGLAYHRAGHWQQAETCYRSILQVEPRHPEALHLMGVVAHRMGRNETAVDLFENAIAVNPGEPRFYNSCGEAQRALYKFDLAVACYERALALEPCLASARYNLGLALQDLGRPEDAIACFEQTLTLAPDLAEAQNNLGVALYELGQQEVAVARFEQALVIDPYSVEAHCNLGTSLKALGKPIEAIFHHQTSMRLRPGEAAYRMAFMEGLSGVQVTRANDAFKKDLIETFSFEGINHQDLAFSTASIVKHSPAFQRVTAFIEGDSNGPSLRDLFEAGLGDLAEDRLFLACLKRAIIRDPLIERTLTRIRRALLHTAVEQKPSGDVGAARIPFVCALARQCFLNEYVYGVSKTEVLDLRKLRQVVAPDAGKVDAYQKARLAILACYMPLCDLEQDQVFVGLLEKSEDNEFSELIVQQIIEISEERRMKGTIETIGAIDNRISRIVRAQYEDNPYPRWLGARHGSGESIRRLMKRLFPHIPLERIPDNQSPDILVAGCGTGQQAIDRSLGIRSSKVLGVDFSLSSLSYAKRKAAELELSNLEFIHADLLNLRLLNRRFELIECIGVLHHMDEPAEGWRVLVDILKPGGLMRIGLYSETARSEVAAAQSFIVDQGYKATSDGMRACRQHLLAMPGGSRFSNITSIVDFYTLSETRDLLFHAREKRFTLPEIADIIDRLGLTFVGFEFNNPLERKKYLDQFPDDPTATSLSNWHKYEEENTHAFIGLYLIWVQKLA